MNETQPYQFPYPECAPPLVEDASDIAHMRNLALAIDSRVTALFNEADDEFITPDACKVSATIVTPSTDGTPVVFNVANFTNKPDMAFANGIRIQTSGFYFISAWLSLTNNTDTTRVNISVEGLGSLITEGIAVGGGAGAQMTGSLVAPLTAGQLVQLIVDSSTNPTPQMNAASLALVRVTGGI